MSTIVKFTWDGDAEALPLDLPGFETELVPEDNSLWVKLIDGRALRFTVGGSAEFDLTTFDFLRGSPNPNIDPEASSRFVTLPEVEDVAPVTG